MAGAQTVKGQAAGTLVLVRKDLFDIRANLFFTLSDGRIARVRVNVPPKDLNRTLEITAKEVLVDGKPSGQFAGDGDLDSLPPSYEESSPRRSVPSLPLLPVSNEDPTEECTPPPLGLWPPVCSLPAYGWFLSSHPSGLVSVCSQQPATQPAHPSAYAMCFVCFMCFTFWQPLPCADGVGWGDTGARGFAPTGPAPRPDLHGKQKGLEDKGRRRRGWPWQRRCIRAVRCCAPARTRVPLLHLTVWSVWRRLFGCRFEVDPSPEGYLRLRSVSSTTARVPQPQPHLTLRL